MNSGSSNDIEITAAEMVRWRHELEDLEERVRLARSVSRMLRLYLLLASIGLFLIFSGLAA